MLSKCLANQLASPSGLLGGMVLAPLWNRRNRALNDLVLERLDLSPCARVLEVGFGGGYLLGRMAAIVSKGLLAGLDSSQTMVDSCERRYRSLIRAGRLDLRLGRAESLPYPDRHFARACSINSIFYWDDAPQGIAELLRVLGAGGLGLLCFTSRENLEDRSFARQGLTLYRTVEVHDMMTVAGFDAIDVIESSDRHRAFVCITGRKPAARHVGAAG
jgi:ubiquinone/menaquinone biosynthesis C-methylase UbiE